MIDRQIYINDLDKAIRQIEEECQFIFMSSLRKKEIHPRSFKKIKRAENKLILLLQLLWKETRYKKLLEIKLQCQKNVASFNAAVASGNPSKIQASGDQLISFLSTSQDELEKYLNIKPTTISTTVQDIMVSQARLSR